MKIPPLGNLEGVCSARDYPALLLDQSRVSLFSDFPPHISSLFRVLPLSFIQTRSLPFAGSDVESFLPFVLEESVKFYLQSHVFFIAWRLVGYLYKRLLSSSLRS